MENSTLDLWSKMAESHKNENTIGDMLDGYKSDQEDDQDVDYSYEAFDENSYTYRLIGIMANGGDDVRTINASCETEAEIIVESFHDGEYHLLSEGDNDIADAALDAYWDSLDNSEAFSKIAFDDYCDNN